jgi:hypothetical protein
MAKNNKVGAARTTTKHNQLGRSKISLHPLDIETALRAALQTGPFPKRAQKQTPSSAVEKSRRS